MGPNKAWRGLIFWFVSNLIMQISSSSSCSDLSKWASALGGNGVEIQNRTPNTSTINFKCAEGFYLVGSSRLSCSHGILNGTLPICSVDVGANGIPTQSSGNSPYYAINSDLMTCSQTLETDSNPWWKVDLLEVVEVSAVRIVLTHHGLDRFMVESMEVRIGNSSNYRDNPICAFLIQDDNEVNVNDTVMIPCAGARGRYVSLNSVNAEPRFLILCKVLVLVDPSKYVNPTQCLSTRDGHLYYQGLARFKVIGGRCVIWRRRKKSQFSEAQRFCRRRNLRLPRTSSDLLHYPNIRSSILVKWLSSHFEFKNSRRAFAWVSLNGEEEEEKTTEPSDCWALDTANAWKWNLRPCNSKAHVVCVSLPKSCVNPDVKFGTRLKKPRASWSKNQHSWLTGTSIEYECMNKSQVISHEAHRTRTCSETGFWTGFAPNCRDSEDEEDGFSEFTTPYREDSDYSYYLETTAPTDSFVETEIEGEIGAPKCGEENVTCSSYFLEDGNQSHLASEGILRHSTSSLRGASLIFIISLLF